MDPAGPDPYSPTLTPPFPRQSGERGQGVRGLFSGELPRCQVKCGVRSVEIQG
jgi:hypothetical protein